VFYFKEHREVTFPEWKKMRPKHGEGGKRSSMESETIAKIWESIGSAASFGDFVCERAWGWWN
jgi:hypothetical protein